MSRFIRHQSKIIGGAVSAKNLQAFIEQSYKEEPSDVIGDFVIDPDLSTYTTKVYTNPETRQTIVAHRGTKGTWDWGNNLAYAMGLYDYTDRYKQGAETQKKAESKYGKENISTIGHSQGAVLSRKLGQDTKEIINVNPAWMGEIPSPNEYNIRSSFDPVSALFMPYSAIQSYVNPKFTQSHNITIPSKSYFDPRTEHKAKILERVDPNLMIGAGQDEPIDFEDIEWGSFTKTFKNFKAKNGYPETLHDFADIVINNPDKFRKKTLLRARFYLNVLVHKPSKKMVGSGLSKSQQIRDYGKMVKHLTSHIIDPNEPIDKKDFKQSKYFINQIMKIKN